MHESFHGLPPVRDEDNVCKQRHPAAEKGGGVCVSLVVRGVLYAKLCHPLPSLMRLFPLTCSIALKTPVLHVWCGGFC